VIFSPAKQVEAVQQLQFDETTTSANEWITSYEERGEHCSGISADNQSDVEITGTAEISDVQSAVSETRETTEEPVAGLEEPAEPYAIEDVEEIEDEETPNNCDSREIAGMDNQADEAEPTGEVYSL